MFSSGRTVISMPQKKQNLQHISHTFRMSQMGTAKKMRKSNWNCYTTLQMSLSLFVWHFLGSFIRQFCHSTTKFEWFDHKHNDFHTHIFMKQMVSIAPLKTISHMNSFKENSIGQKTLDFRIKPIGKSNVSFPTMANLCNGTEWEGVMWKVRRYNYFVAKVLHRIAISLITHVFKELKASFLRIEWIVLHFIWIEIQYFMDSVINKSVMLLVSNRLIWM